MKISNITILFFVSQVNAKFLRNLEHCPTPGGGAVCPYILSPVACGVGYQCVYDNDCLANQAGFVNCLPLQPQCPLPRTGIICPLDKKEVICSNECTYDNSCLANAAGFAANVCKELPLPCNPTTSANCPPTTVPPPHTNPPCNPTTGANCPPPPAVSTRQKTSSTASVSPPVNLPEPPAVNLPEYPLDEVCPRPGTGIVCSMNIDRVACGEGNKCIYDNDCLAQAAGFVKCLPVEEICPSPAEVPCPASFYPVKCGAHHQCVYANECVANAAGFDGCVPEHCPAPATGVPCPVNMDPVKCGSNQDCIYDNQCLASAAGFANCAQVNQPIPQPCNPTTTGCNRHGSYLRG